MNEEYLKDLIQEVHNRGGGLILNQEDRPAAVVMTVDKYNEILSNNSVRAGTSLFGQQTGRSEEQIPNTMTQTAVQEEGFHSNNNKKIFVTGGAGYIGSHTTRELLKAGYEVLIIDNLSSGKLQNVPEGAKFLEGDLGDTNFLKDIFATERIYAVMHFAASIEVEESVKEPQKYLRNNALNMANLLGVMAEFGVKKLIFSSTAAVYGDQETASINEHAKLQPNNPYGYSKLLAERIIKYYCHFAGFQSVIFRFFNACGCDFDGSIRPTHESHLIPIVMEAAMGKRNALTIYGNDYQTKDGTAVRDYVHVLDIARAHVYALEKLGSLESYEIYNIGTGEGKTVMEVVEEARRVLGKKIPTKFAPRRARDAPATVADNSKIKQDLGFELEYSDLETILKTSWHQMNHR